MANDPTNSPNIPPAEEDVSFNPAVEEHPRNAVLPPFDDNEPVIFVAGPGHHLPNNGPRRRPVFGVPFAFMYENEDQEMVNFQCRPFNAEPDLIMSLDTSRSDDAINMFLDASNDPNMDFRQCDCAALNRAQQHAHSGIEHEDPDAAGTAKASKKDDQPKEDDDGAEK